MVVVVPELHPVMINAQISITSDGTRILFIAITSLDNNDTGKNIACGLNIHRSYKTVNGDYFEFP